MEAAVPFYSVLASPQTSFGVRWSRIHFDKRTPKDVCGEANSVQDNGYFGDSFWPKKLLDAKGPFVDQKSG